MKIVINTKTVVPVEIGELKFELDLSDASIEKIQNGYKNLFSDVTEKENIGIKEVKELVFRLFDFFLGEGSGEEIYKAYPSILTCADISEQLLLNITKELEERGTKLGDSKKIKSYLKKNNK